MLTGKETILDNGHETSHRVRQNPDLGGAASFSILNRVFSRLSNAKASDSTPNLKRFRSPKTTWRLSSIIPNPYHPQPIIAQDANSLDLAVPYAQPHTRYSEEQQSDSLQQPIIPSIPWKQDEMAYLRNGGSKIFYGPSLAHKSHHVEGRQFHRQVHIARPYLKPPSTIHTTVYTLTALFLIAST